MTCLHIANKVQSLILHSQRSVDAPKPTITNDSSVAALIRLNKPHGTTRALTPLSIVLFKSIDIRTFNQVYIQ